MFLGLKSKMLVIKQSISILCIRFGMPKKLIFDVKQHHSNLVTCVFPLMYVISNKGI